MLKKISTYYFFLYLLFPRLIIQAQEHGKPFMQIYPFTEYNAHSQNWSIVEDQRGIIYAGNQDGVVMEFDGTNWRQVLIANLSAVRSMAIDKNGVIYIGGENEFGYLARFARKPAIQLINILNRFYKQGFLGRLEPECLGG